ncbi:hypothetical protein [Pedobacter glucosidilyticus]|jgi:hypothetical protein|uniref:hypothetical protein n=1 Tax=Pedobacter glucosidilyticus TaxID=1122941 RepID=UPI0026EDC7AA|nr:hypothetical protein [Pedobacter glucosidilyticus]
MNNTLYFLGGIVSLILGIFIVINQIKFFLRKEKDELGFNFGLLVGGICAIMLGIGLIEHYWVLI